MLVLNKIHIRYEEDYFVTNNPYSFGLVINCLSFKTIDKDVKFKSAIEVTYEEFVPNHKDNLQLKRFDISDVRVYWNTKSEAYIPNSLQEFTKGHRKQIYEAMDEEILRELMLQVFDHVEKDQKYLYGNARFPAAKFQYILDSFSIDSHISYFNVANADVSKLEDHRFRMGFWFSPLKFSFTPSILRDVQNMIEFIENFYILHELQIFKPICNIITTKGNIDFKNKALMNKEKRRNIVRQWFHIYNNFFNSSNTY